MVPVHLVTVEILDVDDGGVSDIYLPLIFLWSARLLEKQCVTGTVGSLTKFLPSLKR